MNYWIRNRKWWWSYLLWGLGVQITNSYVIYKTLKLRHGIKKNLISHHNFIKRITIHWITSGDNNSSSASNSDVNCPLFSISKGVAQGGE